MINAHIPRQAYFHFPYTNTNTKAATDKVPHHMAMQGAPARRTRKLNGAIRPDDAITIYKMKDSRAPKLCKQLAAKVTTIVHSVASLLRKWLLFAFGCS